MQPQSSKIVTNGYVVTIDDLGWVLWALGGVTIPPNLAVGFYVTIVNFRGGVIAFTVPNGSVQSVSGVSTLTSQWQHATLLQIPNSSSYVLLGLT